MKDYYEILEVSRNASKEVIEKAYKVLAKKYHPDLQEEANKKTAEQKMKLINEAYEILSDDAKRRNYNIELENEQKEVREQQIKNYNYTDDEEDEEYYEYEEPLTKKEIKAQIKQEKKAQKEYREEQERQYRSYMRRLGYRVKERWTIKKFIRLLKAIGIIIILLLIIWIFPPTHKILIETYEQNSIIRAIIEIFADIFKGIGNAINSIFKEIFSKL